MHFTSHLQENENENHRCALRATWKKIRYFTSTKGDDKVLYKYQRIRYFTSTQEHEKCASRATFGSGEFGSGEFGSGEFGSGEFGSGDIESGDFDQN